MSNFITKSTKHKITWAGNPDKPELEYIPPPEDLELLQLARVRDLIGGGV